MKSSETSGLIENIYKYINTNIEIAKVEVEERIEAVMKKLIIGAILLILVSTFLIFLLLTIALYLNFILESKYLGFLIVTLLLATGAGIVFYWAKETFRPKTLEEIAKESPETIYYEN